MKNILLLALILKSFTSCAQEVKRDTIIQKDSLKPLEIRWQHIVDGLAISETYAPRKSDINDSKITILKINPAFFDFQLLMGTEHNKLRLSAKEWADSFKLNIVFNAGMYDLARKMMSKGYLKDENHINQVNLLPNYKSLIAFNPKDSSDIKFKVVDLECDDFEKIKKRYSCLAQGLRMLDCNSEPIGWNKRKQYCSQLITTNDVFGNMYLIFVRSPYLHNEMIAYMQEMNLNLFNAIYMEGGPQTSLYVHIQKEDQILFHLEKIGSYVSETYPNDLNDHFWVLPNVIGLKLKN